jgi:hypothetical protein
MNPSTLTAKEVLRMCSPETDLERRLFDLVNELQDDLDSANYELAHADVHEEFDCEDCDETANLISLAVYKLEAGEIQGALSILKGLA